MNLFNQEELLAQLTNPALNTTSTNGVDFFNGLFPALIAIGFIVGIIFFIFVFISGAIAWITAGGDKAQTESARSRIMNALIGLVILFTLYGILNLVNTFFGINIMRIDLGALRIGGNGGAT